MSDVRLYSDEVSASVAIQCERVECMVLEQNGHRVWWYRVLPYGSTPEDAVAAANAHRATHGERSAESYIKPAEFFSVDPDTHETIVYTERRGDG